MSQEDVFMQEQPETDEEETLAVQTEKYLLFLSDGLLFGVPAEDVVEIITGHQVTRLPLVPDYVRGVINLRGQIIPIVDIRMMLDRERCPSDCMMILQKDGNEIGILVDEMKKMVDIDPSKMLPVPARSARELVCGMCKLEDGQTMLAFDCARMLEMN